MCRCCPDGANLLGTCGRRWRRGEENWGKRKSVVPLSCAEMVRVDIRTVGSARRRFVELPAESEVYGFPLRTRFLSPGP